MRMSLFRAIVYMILRDREKEDEEIQIPNL
jgi:hypothetical protein